MSVFDDTNGTYQGNNEPTYLRLRSPYKLLADNTTFVQPIGSGVRAVPLHSFFIVGALVALVVLVIGHLDK